MKTPREILERLLTPTQARNVLDELFLVGLAIERKQPSGPVEMKPHPPFQRPSAGGAVDQQFIDRCMAQWDKRLNTAEISILLGRHEAAVARAVSVGREQRRSQ